MLFGRLSVGCGLSLFGDGLNGGWSVDWLLSAGDIGESRSMSMNRNTGPFCEQTYCCFAQLNIVAVRSGVSELYGLADSLANLYTKRRIQVTNACCGQSGMKIGGGAIGRPRRLQDTRVAPDEADLVNGSLDK